VKKRGILRALLIALGAGLAVAVIAIAAVWSTCGDDWYLRVEQAETQKAITECDAAIEAYRAKAGRLPDSLEQLSTARLRAAPASADMDAGTAQDGWGRPLIYTVSGSEFTVLSYGRDGTPGGRGLDFDLSNQNWRSREWYPTFGQYVFEMPTGALHRGCIACGVLAFLVALVIACMWRAAPDRIDAQRPSPEARR
jgi:type II secretory pathway pseudopilin PulG